MLKYITLREIPDLKEYAADWFHTKWGVPKEAYLDCMDAYLTVGENEQVVIDATGMGKDGKLSIRFMAGVLGPDEFPEEPAYETSVSGGDSAIFTAEPGEYTVEVIAQSTLP